ncbi:hypothetical protein FPQ18DRAFT_322037 [Pyronema domesticum]|uniref:Similar to Uncharacterized protein YPL067C acc. no. Q02754 n=1 Tax=Pyronema omphalodes (strain CBS 100304) TaxID=1076935 RepID=U4LL46_PYROM|nr:hypothetical protein FPQ18DRAFT_322037 [Pyronema domesticum]CCX32814.1 Similar to Uncharacterized protein YPL067C; acc. no. Q02754 [Pyronema omphalodes CBS 100304]
MPNDTSSALTEALDDGYQLTDKDELQLALKDEDYKLATWEELKAIIEENRLEDLKRVPSDLKRYIAWSHRTKKEYGSIQAFVLKERLGWTDLTWKNDTPYADEEDTKILINDWPYGNAPGILHLVCWTKSPIATEGEKGDLTPEARRIIEGWVEKTFTQYLGRENVLWFKNWKSIQSVRSVEHIHVLIRNYEEEWLNGIVGKDARDEVIGEKEKRRAEGEE